MPELWAYNSSAATSLRPRGKKRGSLEAEGRVALGVPIVSQKDKIHSGCLGQYFSGFVVPGSSDALKKITENFKYLFIYVSLYLLVFTLLKIKM